jgi:hypothetical protein
LKEFNAETDLETIRKQRSEEQAKLRNQQCDEVIKSIYEEAKKEYDEAIKNEDNQPTTLTTFIKSKDDREEKRIEEIKMAEDDDDRKSKDLSSKQRQEERNQ